MISGGPPRLPIEGPEEIQELSRGFNQMSEGLERLESERRLMLSGISHDLRTPLARLRVSVELNRSALNPDHALGMIQDITEMDDILGQFLEFARSDAQEAPHSFNLNERVSELCARYRLSGQHIETSLGATGPVRLRKLAIRRLLTNLIDSALCYGVKDVEVSTSRTDSQIVLTVADRGPGIATADPSELIRAFAREEPARGQPGTGLGLAIVERIARTHAGRLDLVNRPGGGLIARVTLHTD